MADTSHGTRHVRKFTVRSFIVKISTHHHLMQEIQKTGGIGMLWYTVACSAQYCVARAQHAIIMHSIINDDRLASNLYNVIITKA
jgi:hypothetical protein